MNHISIRPPQPDDALGVLNVLYKTWLATYPNAEYGITREDIESSYKDSFTAENILNLKFKILNTSENTKRIVAKFGEEIVGTGTLIDNAESAKLKTLYVLPEYQGKGIGRMILDELTKNINKNIFVELAVYNKNAYNFYNKYGFKDTGRRFVDNDITVKKGITIPQMEMVMNK